jgi:hypothetical protein
VVLEFLDRATLEELQPLVMVEVVVAQVLLVVGVLLLVA